MTVLLCTLCAFVAENGSAMGSIDATAEAAIHANLARIGNPLPNGMNAREENQPCAACGTVAAELWTAYTWEGAQ